MRVLHVIPSVAPRYGGPSSAIAPMCRSLADQGMQPLILTTDADGPGRLDVPLGRETTWEGVPTVFFPRDFTEAYKYSRGLGRWVSHHVRDFSIVHVHAVLSYAPLAAAAACRRAGIPYVVRPLGTLDPWSLGQKRFRKRLLLALGARRMLAGAAAIHYTATEEKRLAEKELGLSGGVVIPIGIDADLLAQPVATAEERSSDPYVLVLSRLHPKKNLEPLIEAFARITAKGGRLASWRLVLAGIGQPEYVQRLARLVEQVGARDRIAFAGWAGGDVKRRLLLGASLFALPSLQENWGISLMEALASGLPAIVSDRVDLASVVDAARAGWVVQVDEASLRAGLIEAMSSPAERDVRGAAGRTLARQFAWPRVAGELAALYRRVCRVSAEEAGEPLSASAVHAVRRKAL